MGSMGSDSIILPDPYHTQEYSEIAILMPLVRYSSMLSKVKRIIGSLMPMWAYKTKEKKRYELPYIYLNIRYAHTRTK